MNNERYMELSQYKFPIYSEGTIVGQGLVAEKEKTGRWLSVQMGCDIGTVSQWMTNKVQPSVEQLYDIAKHLDVDVREFLLRQAA